MLSEHLEYVSDAVRLERFEAAIRAVIKEGDRVADLGCGSGILGLLCLRAGAAHIAAIDDSAMIEVARESYARAGLSARASFFRARSQQVDLPTPADVLICDHVGCFGFDYGIVALLQDAKQRLLRVGGSLLPSSLDLEIALVESDRCRLLTEGWLASHVPEELHWLRDESINAIHLVSLRADELLCGSARLGRVALGQCEQDFLSWTVELRIDRDGIVHGLGGWFDCELAPGVRMTNSPIAHRPIRRSQVFLPVGEAVEVRKGDRVVATVMARPTDRWIGWNLEFAASGRRASHFGCQGLLLSRERLARSNPGRVPRQNRDGVARSLVLGYCDGRRTVCEIERALLEDHPELFHSPAEARRFVADTLEGHSE